MATLVLTPSKRPRSLIRTAASAPAVASVRSTRSAISRMCAPPSVQAEKTEDSADDPGLLPAGQDAIALELDLRLRDPRRLDGVVRRDVLAADHAGERDALTLVVHADVLLAADGQVAVRI